MRRRTKPRVAWFPKDSTLTIPFSDPHTPGDSNVLRFAITLGGVAPGNCVTAAVPVVIDQEQNPNAITTSLSDIENSGYRLRRIVGKCFVSVNQEATAGPGLLLCAAAFIVLRSENFTGVPGQPLEHYDLFDSRNDDSPWIWRREWLLQNSLTTQVILPDVPLSNQEYGSAADGPHIDQKTARVVMSDSRLYLVASVMNLSTGLTAQDTSTVLFHATPRVLGSMKSTLGNRRNASR